MKKFYKDLIKAILLLLFLAGVAFAVGTLTSCTTTRYVPVATVKTDTLYKNRKDSVRFISLFNVKDSTRMHDSTAIFYDSKGNIAKQEIWHRSEKYRTEKDSTSYFKNVIDSLFNKKQVAIDKPVPVTKTVVEKYPFSSKARIAIIFFVLGLITGIFHKNILQLCIKLIKSKL